MWKRSWLYVFLAVTPLVYAQDEEELKEAEAEYKERVEKEDFEADPKAHRSLASWCKRNYPEKYDFHQTAYNTYLFDQFEFTMTEPYTLPQLVQLREKAEKLELPEKYAHYTDMWGEVQFKEFAKKLRAGDVKMQKQLLNWCVTQSVAHIESAQDLAKSILEAEPDFPHANVVLGNIQIDGKWSTIDEAFAGYDLKNPNDRIKLHEKFAAARQAEKPSYPSNPLKDAEKHKDVYLMKTKASGGKAKYLIGLSGYSKSRPTALVISLHGGGSGGEAFALEQAHLLCSEFVKTPLKGGNVVLAPVARQHVLHSWGTRSNVEDLFDAIEETALNFNIDRKRIFITGQSMGGGGTALYYQLFPEVAAGYCARAGYYWPCSDTDLMGKGIMVIQGEKDEAFRNNTRDAFVAQVEKLKGDLVHIRLPDVDHFISDEMVMKHLQPYFKDRVNDIEPDFRVWRAAARALIK